MTFAEWAQTDAEKLVRIDLTAHTGTGDSLLLQDGSALLLEDGEELELEGGQVSKYISSRFYYDAVNDVEYLDRLLDPLIIRRSLGGAFGRPEASVGAISIDNCDRELDEWIDYAWHGWPIEIKLGDPSWTADDSRWSTRFIGLADRMEAEDDILTLYVRDKSEKLERSIVERPLIMSEENDLNPMPLSLGEPQNVTNPVGGTADAFFQNPWAIIEKGGAGNPWNAVYENGAPTAKSLIKTTVPGGGHQGFRFDVNDPEGIVTSDPKPALDGAASGSQINQAGEILQRVLTWTVGYEAGFAKGGSTTTIQLDENASSQDDFYVGAGTDKETLGWVKVRKRDSTMQDEGIITAYDGATKTATLDSALSFAVEAKDRYDMVAPSDVNIGTLSSSEIDTAAFDAVDLYDLGIWDSGGQMTYLDLLDTVLPGGFYYYWTSEGKITVGLLKDPSEDTSVFTIDQYETRGKIRLIQDDAPIYRARVGWDRNWTVVQAPADTVTASRAAFLRREYQWELDEDLTVRDEYPEALSQDLPSYLLDRADARTEAQRLMDLFGVSRKRIMVEGLSGLFSVDLHDVVTLKDDTYGLDDGKDYRVVMMEERPIEGTVDVELWG